MSLVGVYMVGTYAGSHRAWSNVPIGTYATGQVSK